MENIIKSQIHLTGFMGSGKSTVGPLLAKKLDFQPLDADRKISESFGKPITEIFHENGEEEFRSAETKLLKSVSTQDEEMVISWGGGIVLKKENREILNQGTWIYLDVPIEILKKRLRNKKHRPLLQDENISIDELFEKREIFYQEAPVKISCQDLPPHEIVNRILERLSL